MLVGAALTAAAGYVVGVLTAPKSGKETRRDIQQKALQVRRQSEKRLKSLHSELGQLIAKGKQRTKNMQASAKARYLKVLANAQTAKDKARDVLSAVHEGGADDEELDKAVKEVNKAVEHLKKYLQKNEQKPSHN